MRGRIGWIMLTALFLIGSEKGLTMEWNLFIHPELTPEMALSVRENTSVLVFPDGRKINAVKKNAALGSLIDLQKIFKQNFPEKTRCIAVAAIESE